MLLELQFCDGEKDVFDVDGRTGRDAFYDRAQFVEILVNAIKKEEDIRLYIIDDNGKRSHAVNFWDAEKWEE